VNKKPDIRVPGETNRRKRKGAKTVSAQRVVISGAFIKAANPAPVPEEPDEPLINLEDTPVGEIFIRKKEKPAKPEKDGEKKEESIDRINGSGRKPAGIAAPKRYSKAGNGVLAALRRFPSFFRFGSSRSSDAALEYAATGRLQSKRSKRNKRIAVYGGSGFLAAAAVLAITFASGGAAAPVSTQTAPAATVSETTRTYAAAPVVESGYQSAIYTASPTPTKTIVPTTPPDKTPVQLDPKAEAKKYMVKADKYYNQMGYSNNHYKYTDKEYYMMAQVMQGEAGGSLEGMVAVGNVVMNRVLSGRYPGNTITEVITAPHQFTGYNPNRVPSAQARYAANLVLNYERWVVPQNTYFFRSGWETGSDWGKNKFYKNIGGNCFFTSTKYGRSSKIPPEMFERTYKWPTMGCKPEDRVYKIQYMLNKLGYGVKADKYFGQDTKDALIDFQKKHKIKADGIAGEKTIVALINAFGIEEYYKKFCASETSAS